MSSRIEELVKQARFLVNELSEEAFRSHGWSAKGHIEHFLRTVEANPNPNSLYRAAHLLNYFIVDEFDWSKEYSNKASNLCEQAERIGKKIEEEQS